MRYILLFLVFVGVLWSTAWQSFSFMPETAHMDRDAATLYLRHSAGGGADGGDAGRYLLMVDDLTAGGPPYSFRVITPLLVRLWTSILPMQLPIAFAYVNTLLAALAATVFFAYLQRFYRFDAGWALAGGLLMCCTFSLQNTLIFPFVDPATYLAAVVVFWAIHARMTWGFGLAATFAVLTKEIFIAVIPVYILVQGLDHAAEIRTLLSGLRNAFAGVRSGARHDGSVRD